MNALREIRRTDEETLTIAIPEEFRHHDLEIIVFPLKQEGDTANHRSHERIFQLVQLSKNALPENYRFSREEVNER